jgi:hypothetical protein
MWGGVLQTDAPVKPSTIGTRPPISGRLQADHFETFQHHIDEVKSARTPVSYPAMLRIGPEREAGIVMISII